MSTGRPSYYALRTGIMSSMTEPVPALAPSQDDQPPVYVPPADTTNSSDTVTDSRVSRETLSSREPHPSLADVAAVKNDAEEIKGDAKDAVAHLVKFSHFPTEELQRFVVSALHRLIDRVL